jgi:hypothetical protein
MAKRICSAKIACIDLVTTVALFIPIAAAAIGTTTALKLSVSPNDSGEPANVVRLKQNATFTATVQTATKPAVLVSVGSVDFLVDGVKVATGVTLKSGQATYTTKALSLGKHTIKANYSGFCGGGICLSASSNSFVVRREPKPH